MRNMKAPLKDYNFLIKRLVLYKRNFKEKRRGVYEKIRYACIALAIAIKNNGYCHLTVHLYVH